MLLDHDFHPDEDSVRVFTTPLPGVLRLDDEVAVTEAVNDGVILRHYSFARHWFKVNVTTDQNGGLIETGDEVHQFAFNCDIATPMEREGNSTFGVDLFIDVLVRSDASTYFVGDEEEFAEMAKRDMMSKGEQRAARAGLSQLLALIEAGRLLPWLNDITPFGPCDPPVAPPMERREVPQRLKPFLRSTW